VLPPPSTGATPPGGQPAFRPATAADAEALRDLERIANLAALAHVFDPAEFPFPDAAVLERWRTVLAEPDVTVEVVDGPSGLLVLAAYDRTRLRHLAVHPDRWGAGLGGAAVRRAAERIRAGGVVPRLWCLDANDRALGLYRRLGWEPSGARRRAEWPPHPTEVELVLEGSDRE